MSSLQTELTLAKLVTREALDALASVNPELTPYKFDKSLPRELKAETDRIIENIILKRLLPTGISVLSEETGQIGEFDEVGLQWVVDPLDGTVNFIRGIAPCAVSIGLLKGNTPLFGVIGEFPSGKIAWGGSCLGAFVEHQSQRVSRINEKSRSVLCTGFPTRFDFGESNMSAFNRRIAAYGKIRMLGAASLSLLQVAKGAAEVYLEQDIMLWDVAAGLAIVQGAGGFTAIKPGRHDNSFEVFASNGYHKDNF